MFQIFSRDRSECTVSTTPSRLKRKTRPSPYERIPAKPIEVNLCDQIWQNQYMYSVLEIISSYCLHNISFTAVTLKINKYSNLGLLFVKSSHDLHGLGNTLNNYNRQCSLILSCACYMEKHGPIHIFWA